MSILIKGMEMPKDCNKCPFLDYEEGFCFASGVKHKSGWYEFTLCPSGIEDSRHKDCPLVPVPPHGRLIDADELENKCQRLARDEWNRSTGTLWGYAYATFESDVEDAPTIIEAEIDDV